MKMIKKGFIIFVLTIVAFTVVGCSIRGLTSPNIEGEKKSKELLQYLNDDDAKGLKSMFCNKTKSSPELDKQIKEVMGFFEGKITSKDPDIQTSSGSLREGKTNLLDIGPYIKDIVTDAGKTYTIRFSSYLINSEDEDKVGISVLTIKSDDGKECIVGEYIK